MYCDDPKPMASPVANVTPSTIERFMSPSSEWDWWRYQGDSRDHDVSALHCGSRGIARHRAHPSRGCHPAECVTITGAAAKSANLAQREEVTQNVQVTPRLRTTSNECGAGRFTPGQALGGDGAQAGRALHRHPIPIDQGERQSRLAVEQRDQRIECCKTALSIARID